MKIFFNNISTSPYQNFGAYGRDIEKRKEVKEEIRQNSKGYFIDTKTSDNPEINKWDTYHVAQGASGIRHISKTIEHPNISDTFLIFEENFITHNGILTHHSETKSNIKTGKIAEKRSTYRRKNGTIFLEREQYFDSKNQNEIFSHAKFYFRDTPALHKEVYKNRKNDTEQIAYKEFRENGSLLIKSKTTKNLEGCRFSFERYNKDDTKDRFKSLKAAGFKDTTYFEHTKIGTSNLPVRKAIMDRSEIEGDKLSLKYYCPNSNNICKEIDILFNLKGEPSFFEGEILENGTKRIMNADFDDESGKLIYFEETQKEKDGTTTIYEFREGKHKITTTKMLENDILCEIIWQGGNKQVNVTYPNKEKESHILPNCEDFDYSAYDEFLEFINKAEKTRKRLLGLDNLQNSYTAY